MCRTTAEQLPTLAGLELGRPNLQRPGTIGKSQLVAAGHNWEVPTCSRRAEASMEVVIAELEVISR